jgi:hypothetical protein
MLDALRICMSSTHSVRFKGGYVRWVFLIFQASKARQRIFEGRLPKDYNVSEEQRILVS